MKKNIILIYLMIISGLLTSCQSDNDKTSTVPGPFKGFSIDAARTVETMDHYFRIVDFAAEWGFNCLVFRITDDEGSALKFKKHPEIKTHEGAFTGEEIKELIEYASYRDIEIIPEIESFGHTKYITEIERYKFLEDILDPSIEWANGICPVSDTTLKLMKDLYSEVAEIFPSKYFHIGCDETNWGGNEMTKKALEEKSKIEIWANYVNQLNGYVKKLGKTSIIWGDVPIREDEELLALLDKDIVLMDWNYWLTDEDKINENAYKMLANGFDIIGAPAVNWMMWGPRVGEFQFRNIQAFKNVYSKINDEQNLGLIITHWCPYRYMQNGQWDSYAIAADMLNEDTLSMEGSLKRFTEIHFGAEWNEDWRKIYEQLYELIPKNKYHGQDLGVNDFYPWQNQEDLQEIFSRSDPLGISFSETIDLLTNQESRINKNHGDYQELLLTVQVMEHMIWRDNKLQAIKESRENIEAVLSQIADTDQDILNKVRANWEKGRKGEMSERHLWEYPRAAAYSAKLANDKTEVMKILNALEKTENN